MIIEKRKILCVDDEFSALKILETILQAHGYEVMFADSGKDALELISKQKIDLVLLDVLMPELNGYEVCRRIRSDERFKNVPIIMVTSLTSKEDRIRSIEAWADDFISKPFDRMELLTRIKVLLKQRESRKHLEEERLKSHMLESVSILAGGIAHDFNNLLAAIIGNIGAVKMRMTPEDKGFQSLSNAEQNCKRAGELSRRLINFSTGGDPVKKVMSLPVILVDVISAMLQGSKITPEFSLPDDLYPVSIDARQMAQVPINMAQNAKEAMPEGGAFIVSGSNYHSSDQDATLLPRGKYVMLSFRDTGVGIPPENLVKIFDPYFSTKETYSEKGMGLGLAVCYSIIKRHDGLITVESECGKGTAFHVYLPAACQEQTGSVIDGEQMQIASMSS